MYLVAYEVGHGKGSPVAAADTPPCVKANKVVTALNIASGMGGNGANSANGQAVVMFLMGLNILTKLELAMLVEVWFAIEDDFSGAHGVRDAARDNKHVAPEDLSIHKLNQHDRGNDGEW